MPLYEIAVSVDVGDAGHALRIAAALDLAALPPARRARVLIDVARAYALRQQVGEAVHALTRAEELGPRADRDVSRPGRSSATCWRWMARRPRR